MHNNKIFIYSLALSFLLHSAALISFSRDFERQKKDRPRKEVHVLYYKLDQSVKEPPKVSSMKKPAESKEPEKIAEIQKVPEVKMKDLEKNSFSEKKEDDIVLPNLPKNFPNRAQYLNYYQIVREKIKKQAYKNYVGDVTGEVFLSFSLISNGYLKDLEVVDSRSISNKFLKSISAKSVRYASPFPPFPQDLYQSELKFQIIISFELKN